MTLQKTTPLFLVAMFTIMYALPAAYGGGILIPPPVFAQASLAQDIIDSAQQEAGSSSADGSILDNSNEFGDDDIPVKEQDNTAEQDSANLGLQDEDAVQEEDVDQDQDATQEDFNFQRGFSQQADDLDVECPPGFTLNENTGLCERTVTQDPTCPPTLFPLTFNPETDLCEATDEPFCVGEGFTYNPETNLCERGTEIGDGPICLVGNLNTDTDLCEASTDPTCAEGFTFNPETDLCEQRQTQPPT